jgi:hypothetical protein
LKFQHLSGVLAGEELRDQLGDAGVLVNPVVQQFEQPELGADAGVDRRNGYARFLGDLRDGGNPVALGGEQPPAATPSPVAITV